MSKSKKSKIPEAQLAGTSDPFPPPTVSFYFNKKHKAPEGFSNLSVDKPVNVSVHGKCTGFRIGQDSSSFDVELGSVEIHPGGSKVKNLKDAYRAGMARASVLEKGKG